jgi:hypothetical protein
MSHINEHSDGCTVNSSSRYTLAVISSNALKIRADEVQSVFYDVLLTVRA